MPKLESTDRAFRRSFARPDPIRCKNILPYYTIMHSIVTSVFAAILFFILAPGVFLRLPANGSKMTVAAVHALVFGVIFYVTHRSVYAYFNPGRRYEGMTETKKPVRENVTGAKKPTGK